MLLDYFLEIFQILLISARLLEKLLDPLPSLTRYLMQEPYLLTSSPAIVMTRTSGQQELSYPKGQFSRRRKKKPEQNFFHCNVAFSPPHSYQKVDVFGILYLYLCINQSNLIRHQRAIHERTNYPCRECELKVTSMFKG